MKLLADECCDAPLITELRLDGHDVLYAVDSLRGTTDELLLQRAYAEDRNLMTEDKDFGELIYRLRMPARGIILLRFEAKDRSLKIQRMRDLLENHSERLSGAFTVLDKNKIRVRPLLR